MKILNELKLEKQSTNELYYFKKPPQYKNLNTFSF